MCIHCVYNVVYFYSSCQIGYNKYIHSNFRCLYNFLNCNQNEIIQFKNNKTTKKYYKTNTDNYFNDNLDVESIYIFVDNKRIKNNCANKIISRSCITFPDYEISNIQFMLIETTINNKVYQIFLKTETYNYFIVDNIFDIHFFKFYFQNYCQMTDIDTLENIKLKILDNNITMVDNIDISSQNYIIIKKDEYIIKNSV